MLPSWHLGYFSSLVVVTIIFVGKASISDSMATMGVPCNLDWSGKKYSRAPCSHTLKSLSDEIHTKEVTPSR